jgi:hypothetical protein
MDKAGYRAAQIEQRVHLHGRFGRTKIGPPKQRQAQIDGRTVERVNGIGEIEPDIVADVQFACAANQHRGDVSPYTPIAQLVCIGQRRTRHCFAQSHAVPLRGLLSETGFDVAQALPVRHLRKRHDAKLLAATKTANPNIAALPRHDPLKTRPRHEIHNLREQRPPQVHGDACDRKNRANYRDSANPSSNRHQIKLASTHCFARLIQPTLSAKPDSSDILTKVWYLACSTRQCQSGRSKRFSEQWCQQWLDASQALDG